MSRRLPSRRSSAVPRASRLTLLLAALAAVAAASLGATPLGAQVLVVVPDSAATDAAIVRARRYADEGNTPAARRLLDSLVLAAETDRAPRLPELLFWRATFAASAADAERDYRRIAVEHSVSSRAEDALLRLAQLELARGDQAMAVRHLERLVLEHPTSPNRARARYWTGRAWLDAGEATKGCDALRDALASASAQDVELRNQVRYAGQRCPRGWDAAVASSAPVVSVPAPVVATASPVTSGGTVPATTTPAPGSATVGAGAPPDTSIAANRPPGVTDSARTAAPARDSVGSSALSAPVPPRAPPAAVRPVAGTTFVVQVAAYGNRAEAETLVRRLSGRGLAARVSGDVAPFRVRIGRFATRAEAARELQAMKAKGMSGFVVDEPAPTGAGAP